MNNGNKILTALLLAIIAAAFYFTLSVSYMTELARSLKYVCLSCDGVK